MATINLNPTKDSFYGTSYSAGPNGSAVNLAYGGWGDFYHSYLQFDLSSIPSGSTITSANLKIYANGTTNGNPGINIHRITSAWVESTLSRSVLPSTNTTSRGVMAKPTGGVYTSVSITSLVQEWFAGTYPNYGCKLHSTANSNSNGNYQSRENTNPPILEVVYTPPAGPSNYNTSFLQCIRRM